MRLFPLYFAVALLFSGCSLKEYTLFQSDQEEVTKVNDKAYEQEIKVDNKILPGERVTIMVYNQMSQGTSELSSMISTRGGTVQQNTNADRLGQLVSKNGTVRLPLIGTVNVSGLTESEAAEMLTQKYEKYLRQPYVSVELTNQRVIMIGEINNPGVVSINNGNMTLIEAIARSGDLNDFADRTSIKILRGDLRKPEVRIIDLTQLASVSISSMILQPNDIVYVQPRSAKGRNLALQEIAPPFQLLSAMLQPFVSMAFLSDWANNR